MQPENSSANGKEPPSPSKSNSLKQFQSAGRGFWSDVPDSDWNDWKWQLKHRITNGGAIAKFLPTLTPEEFAGAKLANTKFALAITPYFFNLIDPADENCPIRLQSHSQARRIPHRAVGDERSRRRRFAFARAGTRASLSRPRFVSGDRPLRRVLPLLHTLAAREQRQRLRFSSGIRQADRLHRRASRDPRRALERRRSAVVERRQAGKSFKPSARDSARGISAYRFAHPDVFAATHHARALRDAENFIRSS